MDNDRTFNDFTCDLQTAKLTDEEREELEGYITIEECSKVLKTFPPGKSTGDDGFTAEFCYCVFDLVSRDLVNSFNAAYNEWELSISQRRGVITLVPKEDSGLSDLSNWWPITLLNLDYKIAAEVIPKRKEKILPRINHPDQTSFVQGRYISQNIRLILYFPIPHNTLCLPPKFYINYCQEILLGICRPPKSISQQ